MLIILFVASGAAALIYEIVWFQMLQLITGSSAVSMAVLLGTFMGGMCLGSLALPRLIGPRRHPLYIYASLELGIAVYALLLLLAVYGLRSGEIIRLRLDDFDWDREVFTVTRAKSLRSQPFTFTPPLMRPSMLNRGAAAIVFSLTSQNRCCRSAREFLEAELGPIKHGVRP